MSLLVKQLKVLIVGHFIPKQSAVMEGSSVHVTASDCQEIKIFNLTLINQ